MATYTEDSNKYASSGVGTAGLTLGVIGTALASGILGNGGFSGLFGGNGSLQQQNQALAMQNAILTSEASSAKTINDGLVAVYTELRKQDKAQDEKTAALSSRVLALETAGPLREQILVDQIQAVGNAANSAIGATNSSLASLQALVQSLTKCVIPITNVCPQPMPQYNSWTAPTTAATGNT